MTSKIEFIDLPAAEEKENEYDPIVAALLEAGEGKGYPLTTTSDEHAKALRRFGEAARRADRTARRHAASEENADGTVTTIVKLRPKVTRKGKTEDAAELSE